MDEVKSNFKIADEVKFIDEAVKRYDTAVSADHDNREEAREDLEFAAGIGHWPEDVRAQREDDGLPCLTINRMPQSIRQVTGDIRRTNPAIKVVVADGAATPELAELKAGIIRQIESSSNASSVYEGAASNAAKCGMGHWRINRRYCDDNTFDQELYIAPIRNPFAVVWDKLALDPTRKDGKYCFVESNMDLSDFREEFPDADESAWESDGVTPGWISDESIKVVEYFWHEPVTYTLGINDYGQTFKDPPAVFMGQKRTVKTHKVMWCKMTAREILEGPTEEPGKFIPVITVTGDEDHIGDRVVRTSVIRYAKDAQRLYNYGRSTQAEVHGLQPRAPYLGTPEMFRGFENLWATSSRTALAYLPYNPDPEAPGAKPERQAPPQASSALQVEVAQAIDDIKATTGIYDAGLGMKSNEVSGKAIDARKLEGDISTSIYVDNLSESILHCGTILLDLLPKIYDSERIVQVLGEDGKAKLETINKMMMTQEGPQTLNDMLQGRYDSQISTGPSYTTQREEAAEGMARFMDAVPEGRMAIAGSIARNMDWPGADEIADRLDKLAPPGIIDKDLEDMSPEEQQAMQQAQQEAQKQQAIQEQMMQLEMRLKAAETALKESQAKKYQAESVNTELTARKTVADTDETRIDIQTKEFQLAVQNAVQSGGFDSAIRDAVARHLTSQMGQTRNP